MVTLRVGPVLSGDLVRVEATLNRPAYEYLAWIDSTRQAQPFYPGTPEDCVSWQTPPAPVDANSFPPGPDAAMPIEGAVGMETVLLLAFD